MLALAGGVLAADSGSPVAYAARALDLIEQRAYEAPRLDWQDTRARVQSQAAQVTTTAGTYPVLQGVLTRLADGVSYLLPPDLAGRVRGAWAGAYGLTLSTGGSVTHVAGTTAGSVLVGDTITRRDITPDGQGVILTVDRPGAGLMQVALPLVLPGLPPNVTPSGAVLAERVGFVRAPGSHGTPDAPVNAYAASLHGVLRTLNATRKCGWVLDLRGHAGGDIATLLAGTGPLLGEGARVTLRGAGVTRVLRYASGSVMDGDVTVVSVPAAVTLDAAPVAVLMGPRTRGAAEIIAAAFRDRPRTLTFGRPTAGTPYWTERVDLHDGAALVLAAGIGEDARGRPVEGAVTPGVSVATPEPARPGGAGDVAAQAAARWVMAQPACRTPPG